MLERMWSKGNPPIYFKSSLDYLCYLIQCECYVNSCNCSVNTNPTYQCLRESVEAPQFVLCNFITQHHQGAPRGQPFVALSCSSYTHSHVPAYMHPFLDASWIPNCINYSKQILPTLHYFKKLFNSFLYLTNSHNSVNQQVK